MGISKEIFSLDASRDRHIGRGLTKRPTRGRVARSRRLKSPARRRLGRESGLSLRSSPPAVCHGARALNLALPRSESPLRWGVFATRPNKNMMVFCGFSLKFMVFDGFFSNFPNFSEFDISPFLFPFLVFFPVFLAYWDYLVSFNFCIPNKNRT